MPTLDEIKELLEKCSWEWTTYKDVNGQLVTGPNGKSIFLPAAGYRWDVSLNNDRWVGYYWSGTLYPNFGYDAYYLGFGSGDRGRHDCDRYYGFTVRPVTE